MQDDIDDVLDRVRADPAMKTILANILAQHAKTKPE